MNEQLSPTTTSKGTPARLESLLESGKNTALAARSEATRKAYRADICHFTEWLRENGLPIRLPQPAEVLIAYIEDARGSAMPSSLARRISSIATCHRLAGVACPTDDTSFREYWKGFRREEAAAGRTVQGDGSEPITGEVLRKLITSCDASPIGRRDRALVLVGWHGAFRRSELVALDIEDIEETPEGLRLRIGRSKTDQVGEGRWIGLTYQANESVCPVRALSAWRTLLLETEGPLFRQVTKGGTIRSDRLGARSVGLVVKKLSKASGLEPADFSAHSLRSGLATQAAADGAPERAIMAQGGWRSETTVRRYIQHGGVFVENVGTFLRL